MKIHTLSFQNFRSYNELHLDCTSHAVHVFIGDNGVGKTNIIEAITLLSLTKSFQSREEIDLIRWGESFYRLEAEVSNSAAEHISIEVASQLEPRKRKLFAVQGVSMQASQLVGTLPTVVFVPQDLDLFTGSPQHRRQFLDQLLCQVSPAYLVALSQYQKLIKQRNALLKKIGEDSASLQDLAVWNQQLAKEGAKITLERLQLMEVWQLSIQEELQALGENWSEVEFTYLRKTQSHTQAELQTEIVQLLESAAKKDVLLQSTSIGPHRDDWGITIAGRNLITFASRGQQRTAMLALILLETSFLELQRGETPVVLLDDVFSELDIAHQSALLAALTTAQVFITTAVEPPTIATAKTWQVTPGAVTAIE